MFTSVDPRVNFPELEDRLIAYWKEHHTFEKSIANRPENKRWTFLDGPPFVTGMPHYGSLLSSLPKDVFGRYFTMKGYRVRRVWGWDGHGLPIENKVEGELAIERKKDIEEKVGVKTFIERCLYYVNHVSSEWEWYVDHIGRWVDFKDAYKTWDTPYMESVMWVFKQMYEKGYIYKGFKVSLYCPHCVTPISNFEVAMDFDNYKEVPDMATTYKFQMQDEPGTYILAWSTTPWNKIVTTVLAINPELSYVKVKQGNEQYILAKSRLEMLRSDIPYEIVQEYIGKELIGKQYVPHYDYFKDAIKPGEKAFELIGASYVSESDGTGVVTIAAYGEEDLKVMQEQQVHIEMHLDEEGMIKSNVPLFGGMYYLKANKAVDENLKERGLLYEEKEFSHRVPLCWRCHTRLYYTPLDAWYVNVQTLKPRMEELNEQVNWFPNHFKHGRFLKSLESAPDWNISRNRYWGSPVPVWECTCGERFVPGSLKELAERSGKTITNLHKPDIDEVTIVCSQCGQTVHRVPEVLDSWIEAGSASFAERHFPFDKSWTLDDFFPPDYIAEYTGQIRAWFYVLHVIGTAIYDAQAFKNVSVTGVILGTDGRKMSKNFKNYPDPKEMLQTYGGDALRLYLLGSPVMHGEDILISEEKYKEQVRGTMLILWNIYNFFVLNANSDGWDGHIQGTEVSENVLDQWLVSRRHMLIDQVTKALDGYDTVVATAAIQDFITDFSTWYIRRSRDRVGSAAENQQDKAACYKTTYETLVTLCKIMAPIAPFIAEEIYQGLTGEESVHLADWPMAGAIDRTLIEKMSFVRRLVENGLSQRKEKQIKVRQPLPAYTITCWQLTDADKDLLQLIKDELNVKTINIKKQDGVIFSKLDVELTPELIAEGQAREIVRQIQDERKKLGTTLTEKVQVTLPEWPESYADYIQKHATVANIMKGDTFHVERLPQ